MFQNPLNPQFRMSPLIQVAVGHTTPNETMHALHLLLWAVRRLFCCSVKVPRALESGPLSINGAHTGLPDV